MRPTSTNQFFTKKVSRTFTEKCLAVERDINLLQGLLDNLNNENFEETEKQVALFALQAHVQRIYRSIEVLTNSQIKLIHSNKLDKLSMQLKNISEEISKNISNVKTMPKADSTIVVVGAGPIGYYSAITLLSQTEKHNSSIALVADKYADFPVRGGVINPWVLIDYAISIGLGKTKNGQEKRDYLQKLIRYVTLREQGDYSIKHLDMLGQAAYLSRGGTLLSGTFDWDKIQTNNAELSTIQLSPQKKGVDAPVIENVKCVINAMGANATYPEGIKREQVTDYKDVLRSNCAQVNVAVSPNLLDKLIQLRDYYYSKGNFSFVPFFFHGYSLAPLEQLTGEPENGVLYFHVADDKTISYTVKTPMNEVVSDKIALKEFNNNMPPSYSPQFTSALLKITTERGHTRLGKQDKDGNYKVQLFPNLTKKESDLLDRIVEQQFKLNEATDSLEAQRELRILFKTQLFLEFLSFKANIPLGDTSLNLLILRDMIKSGKSLCREFKISPPTAPSQEIIEIQGTHTTTTWVGAAALPTIINGRFVPMGIEHAHAVIDHLIDKAFKAGALDEKTKAGERFQYWLNEVQNFLEFEHTNAKDMSNEMANYFYTYPLEMQNNMSITSKMMLHEESDSPKLKK